MPWFTEPSHLWPWKHEGLIWKSYFYCHPPQGTELYILNMSKLLWFIQCPYTTTIIHVIDTTCLILCRSLSRRQNSSKTSKHEQKRASCGVWLWDSGGVILLVLWEVQQMIRGIWELNFKSLDFYFFPLYGMHLCHATQRVLPVENAIAIFLSVTVFEWGLASNVASNVNAAHADARQETRWSVLLTVGIQVFVPGGWVSEEDGFDRNQLI